MSDNVRVYEIAEEAGATSAEVIAKAKDLKIELKSPQTTVSFEDAEEIANYIMTGKSPRLPKEEPKKKPIIKKAAKIEEPIVEEASVEVNVTSEEEPKVSKVSKIEDVAIVEKPLPAKSEEPKVEKINDKEKEVISKPVIVSEEKVVPTVPAANEKPKDEDSEVVIKKIIPKRRGLKIVKKKKPRPEVVEEVIDNARDGIQPKKHMKSLSEILGSVNNSSEASKLADNKRIKTHKKKTIAKAHEHGKVMRVNDNTDFKNSDESILGEEVVLLHLGPPK